MARQPRRNQTPPPRTHALDYYGQLGAGLVQVGGSGAYLAARVVGASITSHRQFLCSALRGQHPRHLVPLVFELESGRFRNLGRACPAVLGTRLIMPVRALATAVTGPNSTVR